jgi:hypothetical protein
MIKLAEIREIRGSSFSRGAHKRKDGDEQPDQVDKRRWIRAEVNGVCHQENAAEQIQHLVRNRITLQ